MTEFPQQSIYLDDPRSEVQPFIPAAARTALDVGCGSGGFGRTLRAVLGDDANIIGVDAEQDNVQRSRVGHGYDQVLHGYFPDAIRDLGSREPFDLITFIDVLEHMFDPWRVLESTRDYLTPQGVVVAAIPNIQLWTVMRSLIRGRWDYTETGILDRTHIRFFTKSTMIEMFEDAGFTVEQCHGVNSEMPQTWPPRRFVNRRILKDMKWLPHVVPDSRWLHFVIVARKN